MTKKILAVSLALCVMFTASSAFANPQWPVQGRPVPPMPLHEAMHHWRNYGSHCECQRPDFGMHESFGRGEPGNFRVRFEPDMPKEIRAIAVEVAKLRIDLDEALHANPMEREKAFEIHDKIMKLEQDVERWKFVKRVDRIEAARKQREEFRQKKMNQAKSSDAETKPEAK